MRHFIHPTAIVAPEAELGDDVHVGPFAVIEAHVRLGKGVRVGPHAWITGETVVGDETRIHKGAVLGDEPQDLAFRPETRSRLEIGCNVVIREHATLHRATTPEGATVIGDDCFLMANSHVAHDCILGQGVIVCNNALLAGYVHVDDRAFISGNVCVHQFARIGMLCMIGGGAEVGRDVPPFTTVTGRSRVTGLNVVGMRRAGLGAAERSAVKAAYKLVFSEAGGAEAALARLEGAPDSDAVRRIREFYASRSRRGFVLPDRAWGRSATGPNTRGGEHG